jgi:hypothetical protein
MPREGEVRCEDGGGGGCMTVLEKTKRPREIRAQRFYKYIWC